jgi:hypothetical protein
MWLEDTELLELGPELLTVIPPREAIANAGPDAV